jgi:hypothetical protein
MALTNAERQKRWRDKRNALARRAEKLIAKAAKGSRRDSAGDAKVSANLAKIRTAYVEAEREQPADYSPLPRWADLQIEMHEAFIFVFHAGMREGRRSTA